MGEKVWAVDLTLDPPAPGMGNPTGSPTVPHCACNNKQDLGKKEEGSTATLSLPHRNLVRIASRFPLPITGFLPRVAILTRKLDGT